MRISESQSSLANNTSTARAGDNSFLSDSNIISNGNHLSLHPSEQDIEQISVAATNVNRLYSSYQQKRYQTKSASIMGLTESKPSDMKLAQLFDIYKDDQEDCILAEGIEQLCKDLQLSPDEFKVLILAWKLNAEQMCRFTRSEFINGLKKMRVDTIKGVQVRLPEYAKEVSNDAEQFKDLYRFTFKFGLDSGSGQRILPSDMAISLWKLVFTVREPPILQRWLRFLENHPTIRGIPRDTWNMFLNFSETINNDLSTYDDNEAWPSLFDDFVEYENDQTNQNVAIKSKECEQMLFESTE
ncbi:DCN1-like protein 3 isoform X2 [Agrilus planipennis]|nr:DCN1-like protein 3 isoform X2 [Agrilus planipennis]